MGGGRGVYRILVGESHRDGDRWGDPGVDGRIIKMNLQEVGCGGMDWIDLVQDMDRQLAGTC